MRSGGVMCKNCVAQLKRRCFVPGCGIEVRPGRLLCGRHWAKVPKVVRSLMGQTYIEGQGLSPAPPNPGFCVATAAAVWFTEHDLDEPTRRDCVDLVKNVIETLKALGWIEEVVHIDHDEAVQKGILPPG